MSAFDDWLTFHEQRGFAVRSFLNPPAPGNVIADTERRLGFVLPSDLKAAWGVANGQIDPRSVKDPTPGSIVRPLFGRYDFISIARAMGTYAGWNDVYTRSGHRHADDWRPGLLPFSLDKRGNSYAVDLAPLAGGPHGQIVLIGPDVEQGRVVASGLDALLRGFINAETN